MDQKEIEKKIEDFIQNFLQSLHISADITFEKLTDQKTLIKINGEEEQGHLIGKQGSTLESLQYLLNILARKENSSSHYRVDINNYQNERDQIFLKRVTGYVQEKSESKEILLWPMSPYERRLVHEFFLQSGTHTTVSEDIGSDRIVRVIKK